MGRENVVQNGWVCTYGAEWISLLLKARARRQTVRPVRPVPAGQPTTEKGHYSVSCVGADRETS